jgi:hypothetical protein
VAAATSARSSRDIATTAHAGHAENHGADEHGDPPVRDRLRVVVRHQDPVQAGPPGRRLDIALVLQLSVHRHLVFAFVCRPVNQLTARPAPAFAQHEASLRTSPSLNTRPSLRTSLRSARVPRSTPGLR